MEASEKLKQTGFDMGKIQTRITASITLMFSTNLRMRSLKSSLMVWEYRSPTKNQLYCY